MTKNRLREGKLTDNKDKAIIKDSNNTAGEEPRADIRLTSEGWIIYYNGEEYPVFDDIMSEEVNEAIAERFNITRKEAYDLRTKLLDNWYPKSLEEFRLLFPTIIGEDDNVKSLVLGLFSQKLRDWKERILAIIIEGPNSSGKSHLASTILGAFTPAHEKSQGTLYEITSATLAFYKRRFTKNSLDRKILYFQQVETLPLELSLMVSEKGLVFGFAEKEDGRWVPILVETEGHPLIVVTAVRFRGRLDWTHRFLTLFTDDSAEQTRRVISFKTRLSMNLEYKEKLHKFQVGCLKVFHKIFRSIPEDLEAVIPFMDEIERSIGFDYEDPKTRRDFDRLIGLLYSSAIAFYHMRPRIKQGDREILVVTDEDLREVYPLLARTLRQSVTGLSRKHEIVIEVLKRWREEIDKTVRTEWPTVKELAEHTKISYNSLRSYIIPDLERRGYVYRDRDSKPMRVMLIREPIFTLDEGIIDRCKGKVEEFLSIHSRSNDQQLNRLISASNPEKQLVIKRSNSLDHQFSEGESLYMADSGIHDQALDHLDHGVRTASPELGNGKYSRSSDDHLIMGVCREGRKGQGRIGEYVEQYTPPLNVIFLHGQSKNLENLRENYVDGRNVILDRGVETIVEEDGGSPPSIDEYEVSNQCFLCGDRDVELYPIRLYGLGYRLLCRRCGDEAVA